MRAVLRGIPPYHRRGQAGQGPATADVVTSMLAVCSGTLAGKRDRALLAFGRLPPQQDVGSNTASIRSNVLARNRATHVFEVFFDPRHTGCLADILPLAGRLLRTKARASSRNAVSSGGKRRSIGRSFLLPSSRWCGYGWRQQFAQFAKPGFVAPPAVHRAAIHRLTRLPLAGRLDDALVALRVKTRVVPR